MKILGCGAFNKTQMHTQSVPHRDIEENRVEDQGSRIGDRAPNLELGAFSFFKSIRPSSIL